MGAFAIPPTTKGNSNTVAQSGNNFGINSGRDTNIKGNVNLNNHVHLHAPDSKPGGASSPASGGGSPSSPPGGGQQGGQQVTVLTPTGQTVTGTPVNPQGQGPGQQLNATG